MDNKKELRTPRFLFLAMRWIVGLHIAIGHRKSNSAEKDKEFLNKMNQAELSDNWIVTTYISFYSPFSLNFLNP